METIRDSYCHCKYPLFCPICGKEFAPLEIEDLPDSVQAELKKLKSNPIKQIEEGEIGYGKTATEMLKLKYADDQWEPIFINIVKFAEEYHRQAKGCLEIKNPM